MKFTLKFFILFYYSLGTIFLPMSDFSTLQDIPKMYQSCKEHEHHDMSPLDFITDHLINIDGVFDKHDNGDEQKPHIPFHFHHNQTVTLYFQEFRNFEFNNYKPVLESKIVTFSYKKSIYIFNPINSVFRPPIFV